MLTKYWNITFRNLLKHKSYTFINIIGLAIAIASSIVIVLYAQNELSFDAFHENADRIQLVYKERNTAQGIVELDDTWFPLSGVMQSRYPQILDGVRIRQEAGHWITFENNKYNGTLTYADPSFFDVFTFPLADGDSSSALSNRNSMVISRATAENYFGTENPIGRTVTVDFSEDYLITGVLEDIPQNSSIHPDIVVPFESRFSIDQLEAANANWGGSFLQTFLLIDESSSVASLEEQFPDLVFSIFGEEGANGTNNMKLKLWSLRSYHDRNVNSNTTSYILLGIAFIIIFMACVNFMNLSVAQSMERAREVGMRKTLGAQKHQLVTQFLGESMLISFVALGAGIVVASMLLPAFNSLYGLELELNLLSDLTLASILIAVGFISGLVSGTYPAFVLSSFNPADSIKGALKSSSHGIRLRNGLSFIQFAVAIILVIGVIVVWQQVQFMKTQNLNFEPEQVLVIPVRLGDFEDQQAAVTRMETFKSEVMNLPGVLSIASSMSVPGNYVNSNTFARPEDWDRDEPLRMLIAGADDKYFETYGMSFLEGRNFSREFATEGSSVILNETAMRDMGWDTAIGKRVNDWTVVGVVEDFHYQSLENDIAAIIHRYGAQDSTNHNFVSIKLNTDDLPSTLEALEVNWQFLDPTRPFEYFFMEEDFENLYRSVDNTNTLITYFTFLSIVIANLGALGLASYSVVQRTKEIGIRKILGADVADIVTLLSIQFIKPVLLANLIAWPIAYFALNQWLNGFAYQISFNWLVLPLAGLIVLGLALLVIIAQSIQAARGDQAIALRAE